MQDWLCNGVLSIPAGICVTFPDLQQLVSNIIIPDSDTADRVIWKIPDNGDLNVKQAYDFIHKPTSATGWTNLLWNKNIPPSHSMLVWRLLHNIMPTDDSFSQRGIPIISRCSLCMHSLETSQHIFFDCPFVSCIWNWLMDKFHVALPIRVMSNCLNLLKINWSPQAKVVVVSCVTSLFHQIWRARNLSRYENLKFDWKTCSSVILANAKLVRDGTTSCSNNS